MKNRLLIFSLALVGSHVSAQQPAEKTGTPSTRQVPTGPLLKPAPEFSAWRIDFIYTEEKSSQNSRAISSALVLSQAESERRLQRVDVTKTGKIIHEFAAYLSGKQVDTWDEGSMQYVKQTGATFWLAKNGVGLDGKPNDATYVPFPALGFRDMDWINAKTYVATIAFGDRSCLVFVRSGADKLDATDSAKLKKQLDTQDVVAYVDADSRLPISMRMGRTVQAYRFGVPPAEMQVLPQDLQAEIKRGEDARARLNVMAPRPY